MNYRLTKREQLEADCWNVTTFLAACAFMIATLYGCGAGELALKDQLAACVTKYNTRPEIDACRAGVEARWFPDAGEGGAK
jgi:hypothetical protein